MCRLKKKDFLKGEETSTESIKTKFTSNLKFNNDTYAEKGVLHLVVQKFCPGESVSRRRRRSSYSNWKRAPASKPCKKWYQNSWASLAEL